MIPIKHTSANGWTWPQARDEIAKEILMVTDPAARKILGLLTLWVNELYEAVGELQNDEKIKRISDLEAQVKLLWGVLRRLPRIEGMYDSIHLSIHLESLAQGVQPMEPK